MHLIISEKLDQPTNEALKWFAHYKKEATVLTIDQVVSADFSTGFDNPLLSFNNYNISFKEIKSIWFRRGRLKLKYDYQSNTDSEVLKQFHIGTKVTIEVFLNYLALTNIRYVGSPFKVNVNKLEVLHIAKRIGFNIPKTIVTDDLKKVRAYFGNTSVITKLLVPMNNVSSDNQKINYLTFNLDENVLEDNEISISLFQEKIEKKYEIRTFFLGGKTFSKAIFSQSDAMTKDDYRNYNNENPNREVPFKLSKSMDEKVCNLMNAIGLNTGSLDFMISEKGEFIFLEVNPIGQFSDLSFNCNYNLERKVVEYLIQL
ncbi:hypothetical protein IMCC3317_13670 [Kordia antarctica]|uniref:ATP-grasp domain-containing protein n=1 Tax=Kordia antarctica TaxID=1218801 RepID=A0A7L4ZJB2_9FLAO|nr:grasp-with-spasm system ATP-grasp peptide maturase [Kordia antarctica]QHI36014.1 hypothetical protein IMCC3317_13670 [Kordia antarctica]